MAYIETSVLKEFAEAPESDTSSVWDMLADAASKIFDHAVGAGENFFSVASDTPSVRTFYADGSRYLRIAPFVGDLGAVTEGYGVIIPSDAYELRDGSLYFDIAHHDGFTFKVSARWGFAEIPADVQFAVIEQAIWLWRKKDLSFTEMSGINSNNISAALSPTLEFVANKYKAKYQNYFV